MLKNKRKKLYLLPIFFCLLIIGCAGESKDVPKTGELLISADPELEADIELDGNATGKTTQATLSDLEPGTYVIKLKKENLSRPDLPFVGEANVKVKAGQKRRITIELNVMTIQPRRQVQAGIVAETEGQKSIIDFYQAINEKDYTTAYGFLTTSHKKAYKSFRTFTKNWENVATVTISSLTPSKLPDDVDALTEIDVIETNIGYLPLKPKAPLTPPVAIQTDPKEAPIQKWAISTIGDAKDPSEIWKISEIKKAN